MDKNIAKILKSYGCGYMVDDYKEMIEEIETYVNYPPIFSRWVVHNE